MIKLFVSDMDGTLLNEHHAISDTTANAIRRLQAHNIEFMIATGRDYTAANALLAAHQLSARIIALNGAASYDEKGQLGTVHALDTDTTQAILAAYSHQDIIVTLKTAHHFYVNNLAAYTTRLRNFFSHLDKEAVEDSMAQFSQYLTNIKTFDQYNPSSESALKFMLITSNTAFLNKARSFFSQYPVDLTSSNFDNLEITSPKAQKGLAIQEYIATVGINPDDVVTIGDSLNDQSMLTSFKHSYAMMNASDTIKSIATHLAPANTQDGVAQVIDKLLTSL